MNSTRKVTFSPPRPRDIRGQPGTRSDRRERSKLLVHCLVCKEKQPLKRGRRDVQRLSLTSRALS